jgi:hypothetical protein
MQISQLLFSGLKRKVLSAWGATPVQVRRLCSRIESRGVRIALIPGVLTWNIGLRAGESGRVHN